MTTKKQKQRTEQWRKMDPKREVSGGAIDAQTIRLKKGATIQHIVEKAIIPILPYDEDPLAPGEWHVKVSIMLQAHRAANHTRSVDTPRRKK